MVVFEKINNNPKGIKAADCVVRAISYATGLDWVTVYNGLCELGLHMKRMPNEKEVYSKYLESLGWTKRQQPRRLDNTKYLVGEIDQLVRFGKVVISLANHLTVADMDLEFMIIDTWDCRRKTIGNYWVK